MFWNILFRSAKTGKLLAETIWGNHRSFLQITSPVVDPPWKDSRLAHGTDAIRTIRGKWLPPLLSRGWSTFYLLTAQPLFMSADPAQKDREIVVVEWLGMWIDDQFVDGTMHKYIMISHLILQMIVVLKHFGIASHDTCMMLQDCWRNFDKGICKARCDLMWCDGSWWALCVRAGPCMH